MVKVKFKKIHPLHSFSFVIIFLFFPFLFILLTTASGYYFFEEKYKNKIYPGVKIASIDFGGKTKEDVFGYFEKQNEPLSDFSLTLEALNQTATVSGSLLKIRYDSQLLSEQTFAIGRSGKILSDTYQKWQAISGNINLSRSVTLNREPLEDALENLSENVKIDPEDALFNFKDGIVTAFKPSRSGRAINVQDTDEKIKDFITKAAEKPQSLEKETHIELRVDTIEPKVKTEDSNTFGIKEMIASGKSTFAHSIPGRVHNVILAASRLNGHLIAPGEIFSFNEALGDVSSTTGFQPAYIIKDGRTVLGDGGGVCQVSTTLFRAALNAGLPIKERHAHSYRVSYYEQDSPPGIDATVFAPSVDLKFTNDTQNYILIQTLADKNNYSLEFIFYGTRDGRISEVSKPVILSQSGAPPAVYEDDPTMTAGTVRQIDWAASGAKVKFDYKVYKNGETIIDETYFSNYTPWRAVYLRGTRT